MMKRYLFIIAILSALYSGCGSFEKKAEKPASGRRYVNYRRTFHEGSVDWWYKNHYIWWKSAENELIEYLGRNYLREKECARKALENIEKMKEAVHPEKQEEFTPYVDELRDFVERVGKGKLRGTEINRYRSKLRRHRLSVEKYFSYEKILIWLVRRKQEGM